ncbi:MAG: hypothetical protein KAI66_03585, partial [Lentisphaeria bacterium]|nr:hypothetical protein [Lentisphaeria bacterium]
MKRQIRVFLVACLMTTGAMTQAAEKEQQVQTAEVQLVKGKDILLRFNHPAGQRQAFLALEARMEMPPHTWRGGFMPCVDYIVNGKKLVDLDRLVSFHDAGDVPVVGGGSSCWRGACGNWRVVYSPDWGPVPRGSTIPVELGDTPYLHVFDISDLVRPGGENEVRIRHDIPNWDMVTAAFRNVRILSSYERPKPLPGFRDVPDLGEKPVLPQRDFRVDYSAEMGGGGAIIVQVAGDRYVVASKFSCPNRGLNRLEAQPADGAKWPVARKNNECLTAECDAYRLDRQLLLHEDRIEVRDTLTNLTDKVLGVRLGHEIRIANGELTKTYMGGLIIPGKVGRAGLGIHTAENPTVYVCRQNSGLALLPRDNVFRAHVSLELRDGAHGIHDRFFALAPHASHTVRWEIYPTARPYYYDFINAARRALKANYVIDGNMAFAHGQQGNMQHGYAVDRRAVTEDGLRRFVHCNNLKYASPLTIFRVDEAGNRVSTSGPTSCTHGTGFMADLGRWNRHWLDKLIATYRRLHPKVRLVVYIDPYLTSEPGAAEKYADSVATHADGSPQLYTGDRLSVMYPTLTNSYGKELGRFFDYLLEHADGFFMDESTLYENVKSGSFSYRDDIWDEHTCLMNLGSGLSEEGATYVVKRKVTSSALYTLPFRLKQLRKAKAMGKAVWMNGAPVAEEECALQSYRFSEVHSNEGPAYSHLTSPLSLANDHMELTERDIGRSIRTKLLYGGLYLTYAIKYETDGNMLQDIYPIHPVELHCGYV